MVEQSGESEEKEVMGEEINDNVRDGMPCCCLYR